MTEDRALDVRGISGKRLRSIILEIIGSMRPGEVLKIVADDPSIKCSIRDLCSASGHSLHAGESEKGIVSLYIEI